MKRVLNYKFLILIASFVLICDQMIKIIALNFNWNIFENQGIAFGLGSQYSETIIYLVLLGLILTLIFFKKMNSEKTDYQIAIGLLLGGGISNLLDRLIYGHVIDYVNILNLSYFNLADIAILFGSALLIIKIWSPKIKDE